MKQKHVSHLLSISGNPHTETFEDDTHVAAWARTYDSFTGQEVPCDIVLRAPHMNLDIGADHWIRGHHGEVWFRLEPALLVSLRPLRRRKTHGLRLEKLMLI